MVKAVLTAIVVMAAIGIIVIAVGGQKPEQAQAQPEVKPEPLFSLYMEDSMRVELDPSLDLDPELAKAFQADLSDHFAQKYGSAVINIKNGRTTIIVQAISKDDFPEPTLESGP